MKKILTICSVLLCFFATICCINNTNKCYANANNEIDVTGKSYVIVDYNSANVLVEKNADAKLQVASIVKLMTTLLTLEELDKGNINLDDKCVASEYASSMGGSQAFVDAYAEYTVKDMLKSVIIASANDSSVVLAEHIAGSEDSFVKKMNSRAKELGLSNTLYTNCTGLPSANQYSTAKDTALLLKEVMKYDIYKKFSTIWMDELVHQSGRKTELVNTNKLIRYYKGCNGGKTGFTDEAGYCLCASAEKNGFKLICVCLGSKSNQDRFNDCAKLFNYGFANFESKPILKANEAVYSDSIKFAKQEISNFSINRDICITTRKGESSNVEIKYVLSDSLSAPIRKNQICGQVLVIKNGVVIETLDLLAMEDIEKVNFIDNLHTIIDNWTI